MLKKNIIIIFAISVILHICPKDDIEIALQNHDKSLWENFDRQKVASDHVLWASYAETTIAAGFGVRETIWEFAILFFSEI